jgi:hypothetical protein
VQQNFIKSVLIKLLDYFSNIPRVTMNSTQQKAFVLEHLQDPPFLEQLYSNEFLLS